MAGRDERLPANRRRQERQQFVLEGREIHEEIEGQDRNQDDLHDMREPPGRRLKDPRDRVHEQRTRLVDRVVERPSEGLGQTAIHGGACVAHRGHNLRFILRHVVGKPRKLPAHRPDRHPHHGDSDHNDQREGGADRAHAGERPAADSNAAEPFDKGKQGVGQHRGQDDGDQHEPEAEEEEHRRSRQHHAGGDSYPAIVARQTPPSTPRQSRSPEAAYAGAYGS